MCDLDDRLSYIELLVLKPDVVLRRIRVSNLIVNIDYQLIGRFARKQLIVYDMTSYFTKVLRFLQRRACSIILNGSQVPRLCSALKFENVFCF